jgi:hypothetical protein
MQYSRNTFETDGAGSRRPPSSFAINANAATAVARWPIALFSSSRSGSFDSVSTPAILSHPLGQMLSNSLFLFAEPFFRTYPVPPQPLPFDLLNLPEPIRL